MMSKRAFISLPTAGRTFPDILTARNNARETLHRLGYATVDNVDYEILSNKTILANNGITRPDLYLLAQGLKEMSRCDAVYFCVGWGSSRECQIEFLVAQKYGLKRLFESHQEGESR